MKDKYNVKVKICGLTCEEDIDSVVKAGADFAGMVVLFSKSRRNIALDRAESLVNRLDLLERKLQTVGDKTAEMRLKTPDTVAVTVSPTVEDVKDIASRGFDYIQIHGDLDKRILEMEDIVSGRLSIIRAYNKIDMEEVNLLNRYDAVRYYLFDAAEPGSGSGFGWNAIPVDKLNKPFFLAGGLTPETVEEAVKKVRPFAVDGSSGVEKDTLPSLEEVAAGMSMKDRDKIIAFTQNAKI